MGEYACGLACISAITNLYGGPISQEKLRLISGTTLNGTSLLGLCQAAEKIGFDAKGYEGDIENLKILGHPVILHVIINTNRQHYVICYGYQNGKFVVGDPSWGIIYYSENELESVWQSKTLLSLKPNENFKRKRKSNRVN
jgi:ATP-binding cassette subfamily B protein